MEYKKKINAKLPLTTALLLLEQLVLTTHIYSAKMKIGCIETGCIDCRLRAVKAIKKAVSDCCPELFDNEAHVEMEIEYDDRAEAVLQAFHQPKFGRIVTTQ